jgi:hypothetical protein
VLTASSPLTQDLVLTDNSPLQPTNLDSPSCSPITHPSSPLTQDFPSCSLITHPSSPLPLVLTDYPPLQLPDYSPLQPIDPGLPLVLTDYSPLQTTDPGLPLVLTDYSPGPSSSLITHPSSPLTCSIPPKLPLMLTRTPRKCPWSLRSDL